MVLCIGTPKKGAQFFQTAMSGILSVTLDVLSSAAVEVADRRKQETPHYLAVFWLAVFHSNLLDVHRLYNTGAKSLTSWRV